jgi:cytohesin/brefeldin A-inhibited guanine nucleotide-exchange protein
MQKNRIAEDFDMFCFSIITTYRSIDLRVSELEIKSKWINYLRAVIINRREIEAKRAEER